MNRFIPVALLSLAVLGLPVRTVAKSLLFVGQTKAAPEIVAADAKAQEHLATLGFTVTFADQRDPVSVADGKDVIVISSGVSAHVVEGKYKSVAVPVVTWESYILPHMGLTGKKEETDFGTRDGKLRYLWLVNAPHPLAAGLPAGLVDVVQKGGPMNWGRPGPGAIIIATFPGELDKSPFFAYEKGATMDGENLAPARRVMIFLDNTTFPGLNEAGVKLFDAAVLWAAGVSRN
ncbi:MAG TPA: hypothetical protein VKC51_01375 [Lacunisphaera sp.]|jgi:hypothetical protein|nr:hypothetical protein [Lacunisphaera sp.]